MPVIFSSIGRYNLETRKVQVTGGSSYIITLPKEWIISAKIKKNDPVGVVVQSDGNLLITPSTTVEASHMTKEFNVDNITDSTYLFRLLIGAYISGYPNIVIKSNSEIQPFVRDCVINFTQVLIGPEIVEEDDHTIITKDLLKPTEMPFDKTIKRMFLLVKSMHENVMLALVERDRNRANEVIHRDMDVDRLQWLVARQANMVLEDFSLSNKMEIKQSNVMFYYTMSRILERVGDHAIIISKYMPVLIDKKLSGKNVDIIKSASDLSIRILSRSMESWQKKDIALANETIESVKQLKQECRKINDIAAHMKGEPAVALSSISESIRRTGEYATDISELMMNRLVND
ncbi:MAG: phosphate uptake regulator PhoU [Thermoplasmata archaeon]|nr:phosphate uptake regulator PhoU [Thermoplasmata archaeon]